MANRLGLKVVTTLACLTLGSEAGGSGLGVESHAPEALDPTFGRQVEAVLAELRGAGHHPILAATFRDPARQELIYEFGKLLEAFGARPMTNARGGQSCHNTQGRAGAAASLAADIVPAPEVTGAAEKAAFFHALGKAATARGLGWGGNWPRRNPTWRKYDLGWDPGHVQAARCRW